MSTFGSVPQINRAPEVPGSRALFHSLREQALIIDKTVKAGYGVLKAGTLMAINTGETDGTDYGKLIPYPELLATVNACNGKSYLVADGANGSAIVYTTISDSYRFALGDHLIIDCDQAVNAQDLGEITAIDRTDANSTRAKITATTNLSDSGGDFTTTNSVCVYCQGGDTSAPFTKAVYVLDQDIDTGEGYDTTYQQSPKGAISSVVVSNAILYKSVILNYDAAALTDLGGTVDGRLLILK